MQSAKAKTPEHFSLADLARSWAEVTGEAWETILYRLGDWAISDAFPDDAFLADVATGTTFHKRLIFDSMRWHRDLVEKLRRVQDRKERDRLQKFADSHIQQAEVALLARDVVIEACRAMNAAPPPILGLVEGVSAGHRTPPECPLDSAVGVFVREAERDQELLRHRNVMPADEAEGHTLLWDAAAEMSRTNGRSLEWSWLCLMDAFWRGDLSPDGLIYFYHGRPGREFVLLDRTALSDPLSDHHHLETAGAKIENLRQWAVADYLGQPTPFGEFFREDPEGRFGLAVLTRELDRWRRSIAPAKLPSEDTPSASSLSSSSSGEATDAGRAEPSRASPNNSMLAAIESALKDLGIPGKDVQWKPFCDRVRAKCKATVTTRGFGNRTIERAVRRIILKSGYAVSDKSNKPDIHDMSDLL